MTSHKQVIRNLMDGKTELKKHSKGHNIELKDYNDEITLIIGYGHAVYGLKYRNCITVFTGWRGYSTTTSKHLTQIKDVVKQDEDHVLNTVNLKPSDKFGSFNMTEQIQDNMPSKQELTAQAL